MADVNAAGRARRCLLFGFLVAFAAAPPASALESGEIGAKWHDKMGDALLNELERMGYPKTRLQGGLRAWSVEGTVYSAPHLLLGEAWTAVTLVVFEPTYLASAQGLFGQWRDGWMFEYEKGEPFGVGAESRAALQLLKPSSDQQDRRRGMVSHQPPLGGPQEGRLAAYAGRAMAMFRCGSVVVVVQHTVTSPEDWDTFLARQEAQGLKVPAIRAQTRALAAGLQGPAKAKAIQVASELARWLQAQRACEVGRTPVVFIPGVAGTELKDSGGYTIWPIRTPGGDASALGLGPDGVSSVGRGATASRVLRQGLADFYSGLLAFLVGRGYQEGKDLADFPYDWRRDNREHFGQLDQLVGDLLRRNPESRKVTLIAHSMGGVIARAYCNSSADRAAKVARIITIATPHYGAPKVFYGLLDGYTFGNPTVSQAFMKVAIHHAPAAYQLVPFEPFIYDSARKQVVSVDDSYRIRYRGLTVVDLNTGQRFEPSPTHDWGFNDGLIERGWAFRQLLGTKREPVAAAGVPHYCILGHGHLTLDGFTLEDPPRGTPAEKVLMLGERRILLRPTFTDGDGTVPLRSLEVSSATATYYITADSDQARIAALAGGTPQAPGLSTMHGSLTEHSEVQQIVGRILDNQPPDPGQYPYQPPKRLPDNEGADFTLQSAARMTIVDPATKARLGFNEQGAVEEAIPGATFVAMASGEYAALPDPNRPYQIEIRGVRDGTFTLQGQARHGGRATAFAYRDVPVKAGTVARLTVNPALDAASPPALAVTAEGRTRQVAAVAATPRPAWLPPWQRTPEPAAPGSSGGVMARPTQPATPAPTPASSGLSFRAVVTGGARTQNLERGFRVIVPQAQGSATVHLSPALEGDFEAALESKILSWRTQPGDIPRVALMAAAQPDFEQTEAMFSVSRVYTGGPPYRINDEMFTSDAWLGGVLQLRTRGQRNVPEASLRLTRKGARMTASYRTPGGPWTELNARDMPFGPRVHLAILVGHFPKQASPPMEVEVVRLVINQ